MRWGEDGAHAVCPLRALFLSEKGPWEAFWKLRQLTCATYQCDAYPPAPREWPTPTLRRAL